MKISVQSFQLKNNWKRPIDQHLHRCHQRPQGQRFNATRNRLEAATPDIDGSPRGRWGIGTRNDPGEPDAPIVVRVWRDSPASLAGLMPGDRIIAIDDARIASHDDMLARLKAAGATAVIDVERRGHVTRLELSDAAR